jgi:hypothetical protein
MSNIPLLMLTFTWPCMFNLSVLIILITKKGMLAFSQLAYKLLKEVN